MTRTTSRRETAAILGLACAATAIATVSAAHLRDDEAVARIWPLVVLAIDYLAGFVVAAAIRIAEPVFRPTSVDGLAIPAVGYGLAVSSGTSGVAAAVAHGTVLSLSIGVPLTVLVAVALALEGHHADLRVDPPLSAATSDAVLDGEPS